MTRMNQRGAATVELAASIPLLTFMAVLLVQAAIVMVDQLAVVQASREAARIAAVNPSKEDVVAAARNATDLNPSQLRVEVGERGEIGQLVQVRVSYQSRVLVPFTGAELLKPTLTARAAMAVET